nr:mucin-4 isoform X1 [Cavia porcellus]
MRGVPRTRQPWVLLSCLCCCLMGNNTTATTCHSLLSQGHTTGGGNASSLSGVSTIPPTTSEISPEMTTTGCTPGSTGDLSLPVTASLTPGTSGISMTTVPNTLSAAPPLSTSSPDTSTSPQSHQAKSAQTTRESETRGPTAVTSSVPLSSPRGNALTGTASPEVSSPLQATTSPPSSVSSSRPSVTSAVGTRTASTDSAPGSTGDTAPPVTKSVLPITSGPSVTAAPAGLSTVPPSTSAQNTASSPPSQQTPSMAATAEAHTVKSADTAAASSSPNRGTSGPGSALPDTSSSFPSSSSTPFTHSPPELSAATHPDSTPGTRATSVFIHSTFAPAMTDVSSTGRPADLSTPTSLTTSPQETAVISKMVQTQSAGTSRGSEATSLDSQVTETISVGTLPPIPTTSGHTSPRIDTHIGPPSSTTQAFPPTQVSGSHGIQTTAPASSSVVADGPSGVDSTTQGHVASHSPSSVGPTSGQVLTLSSSSVAHEDQTARVSASEGSDNRLLTSTMLLSTSSVLLSTTPTHGYPETVQATPSASHPSTGPTYSGPTSSHGGPLDSTLASSLSSKITLEASSPSEHPTLQPSTDFSSSGSPSSAKMGTHQTTPSLHTSTSNSPFSQPTLAPAGSSIWITTTRLPGPTSALSVTSPSSPPTPSSGSTEKAETSGGGNASSLSGVSTIPPTTSEISPEMTTTGCTPGSTGDLSLPVTASLTPGTSGISMTTVPNTLSAAPPLSTSSPDTSTSPQSHQAKSAQTTRESETRGPTAVTSSVPLSSPRGNALTGTASPEVSSPLQATTSPPSSVSSSRPSVTSAVGTRTASTDSAPGSTGDTAPPVTKSVLPITSGPSVTAAPAGLSTVPPSTSAQNTASSPPSQQTPSMAATAEAHTVKSADTAAASSSPNRGTSGPGSALPDTSSSFPSSSSTPFTHSPPELSAATHPDSTPGTRATSVFIHSTFAPAMTDVSSTGRPADLSTPTSLTTSPQETAVISKMVQTQSAGTSRGSEATSLDSQVTETISVGTLPPIPTTSGHTSPRIDTHIGPPSSTTQAFPPTQVSGSHGIQTTAPASSSVVADGPSGVDSTTQGHVASHSPSSVGPTSGQVLTLSSSSVAHEDQTARVSASEGSDNRLLTSTMLLSTSSVLLSTTPTHGYPETVQATPSASHPSTGPTYSGPTSSHGGPLDSTLASSLSSKITLEASSPSEHPTLQPSTDFSSSGSPSSAKMGTHQTTPSLHTSTSNSPFSQPTLAPAGSSIWITTTRLPGPTSALSVTSPSSPPTPSSGSTEKAETSAVMMTSPSTVTSRLLAISPTLLTSTPSTPSVLHSTARLRPFNPEPDVALFPYGQSEGDQHFVRRTVDFTSQLFRIRIGFPLGSSLWDSFYFTDNGQIFFPESDYQIFPYPNPPSGGFNGWNTAATVAPFWDDADFSRQTGNIFYQEYETFYNEDHPLVRQVETSIEKFTDSGSYKAKWTLKVTWVRVSAYPAQQTSGTNTYQAILSTDGSRSYALFLYQSGEMKWDVAQHQGNSSVLMGFSSGDGYFENSPLMSRPLWEKYRPDQFLDPKLGIRGLQVYKLHKEEKPNFRLRCLQRLSSLRPSWTSRLLFCPCSWQQGRWDLRFRPLSLGRWGVRGRYLCSFSSRLGGVCCSYGPWGEFQEGWSVRSPEQLVWELETQHWCCRWNDKPSFCTLYQARSPHVGCATYRPPRPAWMFGDPHIFTLDGANFTFNGLGDFLLVRAQDSNSSFLLQGRTAQTGSANATNFISFAAQYNASGLAPITVQFLLEPNDTVHVFHNNKTVTFETSREDAEGAETFSATGVLLTRNGSLVSASFDSTVTISVTVLSNILHATASLPQEYRNRTEGLLGVWNDNPEDDFRMPNGSSVFTDSEEMLFHYGMTWALNGTGLLGSQSDPLPSSFTPVFFSQLSANHTLVSRCDGVRQCIYDTMATGDIRTGLHTRSLFTAYQRMNATLNQFPPSISGCHVIRAYKDHTSRFQCTSNSANVTFMLQGNHSSFQLFENGILQWTPKSPEPVTLEILARDAQTGLSSVLQPKMVACFCNATSQCLYNQTRRVGHSSMEEASCQCNKDTFGRHCEHFKNLCDEQCFPNVQCTPGKGCGACPQDMTGDGRHCAALLCQNESCPMDYCYNHGHCYLSLTQGCQPTCTCAPAFTDARCFLAGNTFVPSILGELPMRSILLSLCEEENATKEDVNASVAYKLQHLNIRAFLRNSHVERSHSTALPSGRSVQHWMVVSEFQYRPSGPVIYFLNEQLLDAVVSAFLPQARSARWRRSAEARNNVTFQPISREDVLDNQAPLNTSNLSMYFKCNGYEGYHLVYSPQIGVTCVSPCSEGYCQHGGRCQHLPDGPHCSCLTFSIYTYWGERCEHLSLKLDVFFGILFGSLFALLLLGVVAWVALHLWGPSRPKFSYPLTLEN